MSDSDQNIQLVSSSIEQTMAIGAAVARAAENTDVVGLVGELGAGKTQFVRGMAKALDISPGRVTSPTFVFLNEYLADEDDEGSLALVHIDAYRLSGPDDLASIGWEGDGRELRRGAVLAVEWADRITGAFGDDWLEVSLGHIEGGRVMKLSPHGRWTDRMPSLRRVLLRVVQDS